MSATHLNPDLSNTAARYIAKAMTRVHPSQRSELLREIVRLSEEGLRTAAGDRLAEAA